tara:strand:+ start:153 stop:329 length:177 start_codon:yes stop_codon:yes gene_type:complete
MAKKKSLLITKTISMDQFDKLLKDLNDFADQRVNEGVKRKGRSDLFSILQRRGIGVKK